MPKGRRADLLDPLKIAPLFFLVLLAALVVILLAKSWPAVTTIGLGLLGPSWAPSVGKYGVLPALVGTAVTSALAISIALPLAAASAIAVEEFAPVKLRPLLASLQDLSAALPTVLYGLWGVFYLAPAVHRVELLLHDAEASAFAALGLPDVGPFRSYPYSGFTLLTAGVLLAIMIIPYASAIVREGYALVPQDVVEAAYALGATRWEAVRIRLRYIRTYVFSGAFLALGRAMGETVAVALVVGNVAEALPSALTAPGVTISSLIATQFAGALDALTLSALYFAALLLAAAGLALNAIGVYLLGKYA